MKTPHLLALVALAALSAILLLNFASSLSLYTDFASAQQAGREVHVVASWVRRPEASYDPTQDLFKFYLQDSLQHIVEVHYYDPKPANLEQADKLVVIGKYQGPVFVADKILMKCPSKYQPTQLVPNGRTAQVQVLPRP